MPSVYLMEKCVKEEEKWRGKRKEVGRRKKRVSRRTKKRWKAGYMVRVKAVLRTDRDWQGGCHAEKPEGAALSYCPLRLKILNTMLQKQARDNDRTRKKPTDLGSTSVNLVVLRFEYQNQPAGLLTPSCWAPTSDSELVRMVGAWCAFLTSA